MKITMYELLGLIKDGKSPKKIKYSGIEYNLIEGNYVNEFGVNILQHLTYAEYIMTHKVEIIEEPKKIEKIDEILTTDDLECPITYNEMKIWKQVIKEHNKINELIDKINNLKEND